MTYYFFLFFLELWKTFQYSHQLLVIYRCQDSANYKRLFCFLSPCLLNWDNICLISVRQLGHDRSFDTCWCKFKLLGAFQHQFSVSEVYHSCLHGAVPRSTFKVQYSVLQLNRAHKLMEKNRDMAFRSIIKLCYKCHPSREMEFMHTYYYPGNSKGSAYPLA